MDWSQLTNLASNVAIVVAFVWYLRHKDVQTKELAIQGHEAVENLATAVTTMKGSIDLWRADMQTGRDRLTADIDRLADTVREVRSQDHVDRHNPDK